jgi:phage gpG-like protein
MKFDAQKIDLWFDRFDERFAAVPELIGETAVEYYRENFARAQWEGIPWPARKGNPSHPPLRKTGNLFSSISYTVPSRSSVRVSAGRSRRTTYARVHNEGGRVRGVQNVRPYTHPNLFGKGRRQVRSHTRRVDYQMPQRQFIGPSATLNIQIMNRLRAAFNDQ